MRFILPVAIGVLILCVAFVAIMNPRFFSEPTAVAGAAAAILLALLVSRYETHLYPALVAMFLWAGTSVPFQYVGTLGRWILLAAAAVFGVAVAIRRGWMRFEIFHFLAGFARSTWWLTHGISLDAERPWS